MVMDEMQFLKSYSQDHSDIIIASMLLTIFSKKRVQSMTYLDIGANHPIETNNTYLLYLLGMRGICIDASDRFRPLYDIHRKGDNFLDKAIGIDSITSTYYQMSDDRLSSFSKLHVNRWLQWDKNLSILNKKRVKLYTIQEILQKYNNNIMPDIVSIDIEGWNKKVTKNFPFSNKIKDNPLVIRIEYEKHQRDIDRIMCDYGYTLYMNPINLQLQFVDKPINGIFMRNDLINKFFIQRHA